MTTTDLAALDAAMEVALGGLGIRPRRRPAPERPGTRDLRLHLDPHSTARRQHACSAVTAGRRAGRTVHWISPTTAANTAELHTIRRSLLRSETDPRPLLVIDDAARIAAQHPRSLGEVLRVIDTAIECGAEVLVTTGSLGDPLSDEVLSMSPTTTRGFVRRAER